MSNFKIFITVLGNCIVMYEPNAKYSLWWVYRYFPVDILYVAVDSWPYCYWTDTLMSYTKVMIRLWTVDCFDNFYFILEIR